MKSGTMKRLGLAALGAALLATLMVVFLLPWKAKRDEAARIAALGKDFQDGGITTQQNYIRLRDISVRAQSSGKMTDEELKWLLGLMPGQKDALLRARVMGTLGSLKQAPASQKQAISQAIAPYLNSPNALEKNYADRVQHLVINGEAYYRTP